MLIIGVIVSKRAALSLSYVINILFLDTDNKADHTKSMLFLGRKLD